MKLLDAAEHKTVAALCPGRKDLIKIGRLAAKIARENGVELGTVVKFVNGEQRPVKCYAPEEQWIVQRAVEVIDGR